MRPNPISLNPTPDFQIPNGSFENLDSGSTEQGVDNDVGKVESKRFGESVLLTKLENWIDPYRNDAEFWVLERGYSS